MVIGFTAACAIANSSCDFESRSWRGVLDTTVCEILLEVALNTITP